MRISLSINRIEEISFNLLKQHKKDLGLSNEFKSEELFGVLHSIVAEKCIEYRKFPDIQIRSNFSPACYGLFSKIDRVSFKSLISNLINNATESLSSGKGEVKIELMSTSESNVISISDDGQGIAEGAAKSLFTKGFTTKKNGNGLGLYNAKQEVEAAGGSLSFKTELGKGTTFTITLPKSKAPEIFLDAIQADNYERIIVLDDDPAFHEVWSKRLAGLEDKIEHIYSVKEMFSRYQALHPGILLLSDLELMDNDYDGVETILKFNHAAHSVLVTARAEEAAIQNRCLKNGIKLLSKSLVNFITVVKFSSEAPRLIGSDQSSPIILINDDKLVHINWSNYCKKKKLPFLGFTSIDAFLNVAQEFNSCSRIYIDSNLGDGISGEMEAEKIFQLGFNNLFLATGYEKGDINKPFWIKEVYSNSPENISLI
jgi:CheY-like chemotaxis protein